MGVLDYFSWQESYIYLGKKSLGENKVSDIFGTLSKITQLDVFQTLLGVIVLWWGIKLYVTEYLKGLPSTEMGMLILGLVIVGYFLFAVGFSNWRERDKKEQELEDKIRERKLKEEEYMLRKVEKNIKILNGKERYPIYTNSQS